MLFITSNRFHYICGMACRYSFFPGAILLHEKSSVMYRLGCKPISLFIIVLVRGCRGHVKQFTIVQNLVQPNTRNSEHLFSGENRAKTV